MEICSKMLEAHYTTETKIQPISNLIANPPTTIPQHKLYSDKEADKKLAEINNDIYLGAQKEKSEKGFNKKLYLKLFALITLCIAAAAGLKKFFKR